MKPTEPDFKTACGWWPEYPNKWTPIGWRDHMQVFSVLWNGSIVANPAITPAARWGDWKDEPKMHLHLMPGADHKPPYEWTVNAGSRRVDDGMVRQGWLPGGSPVMYSEWAADGVSLRAEVLGHLAGGGRVKTGREHLFAWIRIRIADFVPALPLPPRPSWRPSTRRVRWKPRFSGGRSAGGW